MPNRYTDVDRMILKRWDEVIALRDAFDELLDRMEDVVDATLQRVSTTLAERDLACEFDVRRAVLWFWKREWSSRKSNAGMWFEVSDCVPLQYTKGVGNHPIMWFKTEEFSKFKVRESSEDFARALRSALTPNLLKQWGHHEANLADAPLGRECTEIPEAERVRLMTEPDALHTFLVARVDECLELVPAIDATLKKMTRR